MNAPPGPDKAKTLLYAAPLAVFTAAGLVGVAFMPYFLTHSPLGLIALSPLFRHLVLVTPMVDAGSLFAVAVPRHFAPDPFVYLLGRDYGPLAVDWVETNSPFMGKVVRGLERLFARVGALALLVSPDIVVSTLAGAARVPWPLFVAMNLLGTFINVAVARWFGDVLEAQIHALVVYFQAHLVAVTLVTLALFSALNWLSARRRSNGAGSSDL